MKILNPWYNKSNPVSYKYYIVSEVVYKNNEFKIHKNKMEQNSFLYTCMGHAILELGGVNTELVDLLASEKKGKFDLIFNSSMSFLFNRAMERVYKIK